MRAFEYVRAFGVAEAVAALAECDGEAKVLAGGTSLLFFLRSGLLSARRLVDISRVGGLQAIAEDADGGVAIGGLVTHRELERSDVVRRHLAFLPELEREIGTVQMRNRGTVGGNLCHADPAGDLAPAFLAIGGYVEIAGGAGIRQVPLDDFFHDYYTTDVQASEILTGVRLRAMPPRAAGAYVKYVSRMRNDFTLVGVAAVVALDAQDRCGHARIATSGAAAHAFRAADAEAALQGERLSPALMARAGALAAQAANPIGDHRGSAEYRRDMVKVITARAVQAAWHRAAAMGVR